MSGLRRFLHTLRSRRLERELEQELRFHLDMRIEEYRRAGMAPAEARRAARLRFGNPASLLERTREVDILGWLESFWQDAESSPIPFRGAPRKSESGWPWGPARAG